MLEQIKTFLRFVEIQTKIASVFPFIFGTLYSYYHTGSFYFLKFIVMFVSMLTFDMCCTAINNYMAYKNEKFGQHLVGFELAPYKARLIIYALLFIATLTGIILVMMTSMVVLFIGIICFFVGIFYTFGPLPICRMPLGEILSGFCMGFFITFLAFYIHNIDIFTIGFDSKQTNILRISIDVAENFGLLLVATPFILLIANLMLCNNICDLEKDMKNRRFTLVYFITLPKSLLLFAILYYLYYFVILLAVIIGLLPVWSVLTLFTIVFVSRSIKRFCIRHDKDKDFIIAVKNLVLLSSVYCATLVLGIIF